MCRAPGSAGDIFLQSMFPLHSGRIIGIPGRMLMSLMGAADRDALRHGRADLGAQAARPRALGGRARGRCGLARGGADIINAPHPRRDPMRLAGKVAIVTGGGSGFGEGIATKFVAEGARVLIADRDAAGGERVAKTLGANARACRSTLRKPPMWPR